MRDKTIKLISAILLVVLGSLMAWLMVGRPLTGIDDADIFLVYARNFADGHGFVYNIGGERVEGFTSMLWVHICSALFRLFSAVELPLVVINLILAGTAIYVCLKRSKQWGLYAALLFAVPGWFAWSSITLMETGLWCLLITLLGLAVAERRIAATLLLLPLLIITRPEFMLWGAWALVLIFLRAEPGKRIKASLLPALAYVVALAALVGFRLWYFGYPVPNTYYAKVSPGLMSNIGSGLRYFLGYAIHNIAVLIALGACVLTLLKSTDKRSDGFFLALFLLPGIGIPVLVGGDHFGAFRFYQPLWPLLCLLAAERLPRIISRFQSNKVRLVLVVMVLSGWLLFPYTANLKHEFRIAHEGRDTGRALSAMFSDLDELPSVAVVTAGGIKVAYSGKVLDVLGLNSTEMGHAPGPRKGFKNHTAFNRDIFYEWAPDILLRGDSHEFDLLVLKGLHDEVQFNERYVAGTLMRNGSSVSAYYSRSLLDRVGGTFMVE